MFDYALNSVCWSQFPYGSIENTAAVDPKRIFARGKISKMKEFIEIFLFNSALLYFQ